ncbi:MAG: hypothetical protein V4532_19350, partial [Pseudomonadota bacterium]
TRVVRWVNNSASPALSAVWNFGGDLIAHMVSCHEHRTPGRLLGFSSDEIKQAFIQVASAIAPPNAHSHVGAV